MSVTLNDLLKLPIFQSNTKLLSEYGKDNIVRYITIVETSNTNFSSFGSDVFILTTLSSYYNSEEEIINFIQGLCNAKVSAIGIKVGRFINKVPDEVIKIANEYHVALLSISSNVYFREILSDALSLITGNQQIILNRINNLNQTIINAVIQNSSIQTLVDLFSSDIECYCCCISPIGKKIAESNTLSEAIGFNDLNDALDEYLHSFDIKSGYFHRDNAFIFPCIAQGKLMASFCIITQDFDENLVCSLSHTIISAINIKFLGQNLSVQLEQELISSMFDDIIFSSKIDTLSTVERLESFNFKLLKYTAMLLFSFQNVDKINNFFQAPKLIQRIVSYKFPSAIAFRRGNKYAVLISTNTEFNTSSLQSALEGIRNTFLDFDNIEFDIGCSMMTTDFNKISECYSQARNALRFGNIIDNTQHVFLYERFFEIGFISNSLDKNEAKILYEKIIEPINTYDQQFKLDLMKTIHACFSNEKLKEASDILHIHISTLRYRLQKIEDLTGYSFFNMKDRLILYMAYIQFRLSLDDEEDQ